MRQGVPVPSRWRCAKNAPSSSAMTKSLRRQRSSRKHPWTTHRLWMRSNWPNERKTLDVRPNCCAARKKSWRRSARTARPKRLALPRLSRNGLRQSRKPQKKRPPKPRLPSQRRQPSSTQRVLPLHALPNTKGPSWLRWSVNLLRVRWQKSKPRRSVPMTCVPKSWKSAVARPKPRPPTSAP